MNKKIFTSIIVILLGISQGFSQFSFNADAGFSGFSNSYFLTTTSYSHFTSIALTYKTQSKFFVRIGAESYAISPATNSEIRLISVPFTVGTSISNANFEQFIGLGYVMTFSDKFINMDGQNFVNHGITTLIENRFYLSDKGFFTVGLNTHISLTNSSYIEKFSKNSSIYLGVGFKLGKPKEK